MMISTGHTQAIMDVIEAFGWKNLSDKDLEALYYALTNYVKMRRM